MNYELIRNFAAEIKLIDYYANMKLMKKILFLLAFISVVISCENKQHSVLKQSEVDSLIAEVNQNKDGQRLLALADSLEQAGQISLFHASNMRGTAYVEQNNFPLAEEEFKKGSSTSPDNYEDSIAYLNCAVSLIQLQAIRKDHDAVLHSAVPILDVLEHISVKPEHALEIYDQKFVLLEYLGSSQMLLGKTADATRSYNAAYKYASEMIKLSQTWDMLSNVAISTNSIASHYIRIKDYNTAEIWLARSDSMATRMYACSDVPDSYVNTIKGLCNYAHARVSFALNRPQEAEQYFNEFLKTTYSQTAFGHVKSGTYYYETQRYSQAADAYKWMDRLFKDYNLSPTFDNLDFVVEKFNANLKAGRKDSALAMAVYALNFVDSALVRQKNSEAAKLATIYETKQKDEAIAQQQIELNRQKIFALMVAMGLITVFFIVYTIFRRRAARRLAEVKAQQERIESELRIARDIQMSMVPSVFPDREGLDMYASMTPAKEVGGDLYGYVINGHNLYFAIGDVSGKGVPASLFMAQATRLFRTMANQGLLPAEICTHMNTELSGDDNVNGMFVTMFIGMLDMESGRLQFCNAGHNPPVLGGGDNQGDFLQMEPNGPIGLWPQLEYVGEELDNIKGRALFVYTDGLNEAEDALHNQFGDERMLAILRQTRFNSARQVVETLFAKVEEHRAGAEPNDDLTMLCLRVS